MAHLLPPGIAHNAKPLEKHRISTEGGTKGGDIAGDFPDLQAIVDAWPDLSEDVKADILAMVRAAGE